MLIDMLDSLFRPGAYRRFCAEPSGRAAGYVAFLSVIFVGALGLSVKLRLAPLFDETFTWLETSMPTLRVSNGVITSSPPGPVRIEHPTLKGVALEIDTTRKDPITPKEMTSLKVRAFLTSNALYLENEGSVQALDLSHAAEDRPTVIDTQSYKAMQRAFDWVFYPALLLTFFLLFAASLALFASLYALAGLLVSSLSNAGLGYAALFRIALHAQTAAALLRALDTTLPVPIPGLLIASPIVSAVYLWLGIRGATGPKAAAPSAPAPQTPPAASA